MFKSILGALVEPVASVFKAKEERKKAVESAKVKLAQARQDSSYNLEMSDKEWEVTAKQQEAASWKDEYVTVIITFPLIMLFFAGVLSAFTGDIKYIDSVNVGIASLKQLDINLGDLLKIVVLAAVGIKGLGVLRG